MTPEERDAKIRAVMAGSRGDCGHGDEGWDQFDCYPCAREQIERLENAIGKLIDEAEGAKACWHSWVEASREQTDYTKSLLNELAKKDKELAEAKGDTERQLWDLEAKLAASFLAQLAEANAKADRYRKAIAAAMEGDPEEDPYESLKQRVEILSEALSTPEPKEKT